MSNACMDKGYDYDEVREIVKEFGFIAHIKASGEKKCIDKSLEDDIADILKHSGLISSFDEITASYRVLGMGTSTMLDLSPQIETDIDWKSSLKAELEYLKSEGLILITEQDISEISDLANIENCNPFPASSIPAGPIKFNSSSKVSTYYLIPIVLVASFFILVILLIVIARLIERKNPNYG